MTAEISSYPPAAALAAGEAWAWAKLHRLCAPGLANFLAASGVDDVDRAVGEVFVHVARRISTYDGGSDGLRVFVFAVARRYVREDPSLADRVGSGDPGEVGRMQVREVLAELDADEREVLLLRVAAGLEVADVAAVLSKDLAWVEATERKAAGTLGDVVF